MSPPVNENRPAPSRRGLRLATLIAAGLCVLATAAGAFVFSYPSVRDTALTAGVSPRLARFYPLLFDAVLVVACAAAVTLRGLLRAYAWLAVLVIIGAIATADIVHALSITVPKRPLEVTIAVAPWVVLLTGLSLLDAMIRRSPGRKAGAAAPVPANGRAPAARSPGPTAGQPADAVVVPLSALLHDSPTAPASRAQATAGPAQATVSPTQATAGLPQATVTPSQATVSPPQATAGPAQATVSPAQATADPHHITAGPADDPVQPAVAGSPAPAPQAPPAPPTPRPPEQDTPGDAQTDVADPVT